MRVLIVNTNERTGGAAIAANRLVDALNRHGVKAKMMVAHKQSDDLCVVPVGTPVGNRLRKAWERVVIWVNNLLSRRNLFAVSIANTGFDITKTREFQEADVIHLHWVNQGLLSLRGISRILQSGKPVVWTMHDMWPLTAICHHAHECNRFATSCERCPFLRVPCSHDLSHRVFRRKQRVLQGRQLQFVAVSEWLAGKARQSALIGRQPITVIPNSLMLSRFKLLDRTVARRSLGLVHSRVVAFGAARIDDPIKGFGYLLEALRLVAEHGQVPQTELHLLLFGELRNRELLAQVPAAYTYLGYVSSEDELSEIYSAADVVVSSSLYETFGQTLIEAMACGCVPVSFEGSGQADIIRHRQNGYLARRLDAVSLADGIEWAMTCGLDRKRLRKEVVSRFSDEVVAQQYVKLYEEL